MPAKWVHHAPVEHFRTFLPPRTASPQCLHQFGGQAWTKWQQHTQSTSPTSLASLGAVQCQPAVPQEDATPTTATSPPPQPQKHHWVGRQSSSEGCQGGLHPPNPHGNTQELSLAAGNKTGSRHEAGTHRSFPEVVFPAPPFKNIRQIFFFCRVKIMTASSLEGIFTEPI